MTYDYEHKNKTDQFFYGSGDSGCSCGCGLVFAGVILFVFLFGYIMMFVPNGETILIVFLFGSFVLSLPLLVLYQWLSGLLERRRANRRFFPEEDKTALREILRIEQSWLASDVEKWLKEERNLYFSTYEATYWWEKIRQENLLEKTPEPPLEPQMPSNNYSPSGDGGDMAVCIVVVFGIAGFSTALLIDWSGLALPVWLSFLLIIPVAIIEVCLVVAFGFGIAWLIRKIENWIE